MSITAKGIVSAICIAPGPKQPMVYINSVVAIAGHGLEGDRYCQGNGSYNKGKVGKRQVSLLNSRFLMGSGYAHIDTRRNILTTGVPLHSLIGQEFQIGAAVFRGIEPCAPCRMPTVLGGEKLKNARPFNVAFDDCGGLLAEVVSGGAISIGDAITTTVTVYG